MANLITLTFQSFFVALLLLLFLCLACGAAFAGAPIVVSFYDWGLLMVLFHVIFKGKSSTFIPVRLTLFDQTVKWLAFN